MPYIFLFALINFVAVRKTADKNFIMAFGKQLRKLRQDKKMSMQTLAYTINVEYSQISRIELGKINTTISMTHDIATALEIPVKMLFDFEVMET